MLKIIITFFIFSVLCFKGYSQQADTSKILLRFSEPMSHEGIFNILNYKIIKDDLTPVKIYKIGVVPGDSAVVLYTEKYIDKNGYRIIVSNLKDKSGNLINSEHNTVFLTSTANR